MISPTLLRSPVRRCDVLQARRPHPVCRPPSAAGRCRLRLPAALPCRCTLNRASGCARSRVVASNFARMSEVEQLYRQIIGGWNSHSGNAFAAPFADDGEMIGFDGSHEQGREAIAASLNAIFADHETAPYVVKVKEVRQLGEDAAMLRAAAGMIPPGKSELAPSRNAWQTVVAARHDDEWRVVLFQTTPAQFHGRPEETRRFTSDLAADSATARD